MNATCRKPVQPSVSMTAAKHGDTPRRMKVFVAFDEDDCARNAEALIHRVAPDELCDTELHRLDQLATLAQSVRTWLSRSLTLRDNDREGVLVVLLSGANAQSGANTELLAYLETLAVLSRLEFFAGCADSKAVAYAELAPPPVTNFAQFTATIHAPDSLHVWEINE